MITTPTLAAADVAVIVAVIVAVPVVVTVVTERRSQEAVPKYISNVGSSRGGIVNQFGVSIDSMHEQIHCAHMYYSMMISFTSACN